MTEVFVVVFRSPISGDIQGEVYGSKPVADMMAVAFSSTYNTSVKVMREEVELP